MGFRATFPYLPIDLCEVINRGEIPLEQLSVVADAGTTPFQAAKQAQLEIGDNVIVIGVGGVGQYIVQIAKALGAGCVIAVDINQERLDKMLGYGADVTINSMGKPIKDVVGEFKGIQKQLGLPGFGWKIFEVSGTRPGQEAALARLSFTGKLMIVGFGMQKVEYSISRLMAFDAEIIGTWGCLPEYYPQVLSMVFSGKIDLAPFVQTRSMSTIVAAFEEAHRNSPEQRIVLVPDF